MSVRTLNAVSVYQCTARARAILRLGKGEREVDGESESESASVARTHLPIAVRGKTRG